MEMLFLVQQLVLSSFRWGRILRCAMIPAAISSNLLAASGGHDGDSEHPPPTRLPTVSSTAGLAASGEHGVSSPPSYHDSSVSA